LEYPPRDPAAGLSCQILEKVAHANVLFVFCRRGLSAARPCSRAPPRPDHVRRSRFLVAADPDNAPAARLYETFPVPHCDRFAYRGAANAPGVPTASRFVEHDLLRRRLDTILKDSFLQGLKAPVFLKLFPATIRRSDLCLIPWWARRLGLVRRARPLSFWLGDVIPVKNYYLFLACHARM